MYLSAQLDITKSVDRTTAQCGLSFTYTLQYACPSTTTNCEGVTIVDALPPEVEYLSSVGSTHTISETYDPVTHEVTFDFIEPLPAGSTGEVKITVRFPNGSTPNGTVATNTATIDATNAAPVVSNEVSTTASAVDRMIISKAVDVEGTIDGNTSYYVQICNGQSGVTTSGSLFPTGDVVIVDQLPPGSVYDSSTHNGVYNATNHTITWTFPATDFGLGDCQWPKVTVVFPSGTFNVGDTVTNSADYSYTPIGEPVQTGTVTATSTIPGATPLYTLNKMSYATLAYPGETGTYFMNVANDGNVDVSDLCIEDYAPAGLEFTGLRPGAYYFAGPPANIVLTVDYQTNLNSTWTTEPNGPYTDDDHGYVGFSSLLGSGEYVTAVRICFGPDAVPAGYATYDDIEIYYRVRDDAPAGIATNCIDISETSPETFAIQGDPCHDIEILESLSGALVDPEKYIVDWQPSYQPGDIVTFNVTLGNHIASADALQNPTLVDLLPIYFDYVPGSWYVNNSNVSGPAPTPAFTETTNYNSTGQTLLEWSLNGYNLLPGEDIDIRFDVEILNTVIAPAFENGVHITGDNINNVCYETLVVDSKDVDKDGDTTEQICCAITSGTVSSIPSLESEKLVKGQLDTQWTKYPDSGLTTPGGLADYTLEVCNTGTVPMTDIVVLDILPHIGDAGVIDLSPRNTQWEPVLAGPVTAPSGVTVYYSTEKNPCRSAEGLVPSGPTGCAAPNWTTAPPNPITSVSSLKFDFGTMVVNPGECLDLMWEMRAPVDAPTNGEIAWNSFGYIANTVDGDPVLPSEPIKVGIAIEPIDPAAHGDFVWNDLNQDGIQDPGEPGIPGVNVAIYQDNGDGNADPNTDTYVNFTVTDNTGHFIFPNLPAGDYFLVFTQPAGMTPSPTGVGNDNTIDSDGLITGIVSLAALDVDLTCDLGLYSVSSCDVLISNIVVSPCSYNTVTGQSTVEVNVYVDWANAPSGQDINVSINGGTSQSINVSGGASNPALVQFTMPADGSSNNLVMASFSSTTSCGDTQTYSAPVSCAPFTCSLQITDVDVGPCTYDANSGTSTAFVDVEVTWSYAPSGEMIEVMLDGQTMTVNPATESSPSTVRFFITPDSSLNNPISAEFETSTSCADTDDYNSPSPCSPGCPNSDCVVIRAVAN